MMLFYRTSHGAFHVADNPTKMRCGQALVVPAIPVGKHIPSIGAGWNFELCGRCRNYARHVKPLQTTGKPTGKLVVA